MTRRALGLAAAALLAGCATPAPPEPPARVPDLRSEVVVDRPDRSFICPSGALAEVRINAVAGMAAVTYMGETTTMAQQIGRGFPTYVAGESTLVLEPTRAVLRRGRSRVLACPARPEAPEHGVLWGTLSKLDRSALVPGSRARVLIVDVSRADAPAIEVARTQIVTEGNQVPLHVLIRYDPSRILPGMRYGLSARIEDPRGQLRYITDTFVPLFETAGAPQPPVDLMLVNAPASP